MSAAATDLPAVAAHLREQIADRCDSGPIPGYVAGVYHDGAQAIWPSDTARHRISSAMRDDTRTRSARSRSATTTLVMQQVERGRIDLDQPVTGYLPEFHLTDSGAAGRICGRHLLSHTNGIDADLLFVDANGPGALQTYLHELGRSCGTLFEPGRYVALLNGGMIVAGRLLEMVTGTPYHRLLEREIYAPIGMGDSSTSAEQAILRSTAVGHFDDPRTDGVRPTGMFKLPDSWAPAGSTPIGTIGDLLAFARTHLAGGRSPIGERVLSDESTTRMRTVTHDMGTPNVPPIGLGWLIMPIRATSVLSMSGASPGGVAVLAVVPDFDFAFAAYGNHMGAMALHDQLLLSLLREYFDIEAPDLVTATAGGDLGRYAGSYRSNQLRVEVGVVDGQLEETTSTSRPTTPRPGCTPGSPAGCPHPTHGAWSRSGGTCSPGRCSAGSFADPRQPLVLYHGIRDGRAAHRCAGGRMTRRDDIGCERRPAASNRETRPVGGEHDHHRPARRLRRGDRQGRPPLSPQGPARRATARPSATAGTRRRGRACSSRSGRWPRPASRWPGSRSFSRRTPRPSRPRSPRSTRLCSNARTTSTAPAAGSARLEAGDRLFVSPQVRDYLDRLHELGVSRRTLQMERDGWILMQSVSPDDAAAWVADKLDALDDPEFRAIYLQYDAAFDWSPDDPRLGALAERTRQWLAGRRDRSGSRAVRDPVRAHL